MRTEDKLGYLFLGVSLTIWYVNGHPTTASYFANGIALGFFIRSAYIQLRNKKK